MTEKNIDKYNNFSVIYACNKSEILKCKMYDKYVIIKKYYKNLLSISQRNRIKKEIDIISKLNHPNIVKYIEDFSDIKYIYIVQEYGEKGDLFSIVLQFHNKKLPENHVKIKIIKPLLYAVEYIHNIGIIHMDIKPENIIVMKDWTIKLCDFGLSCYKTDILCEKIGTKEFMAPEVISLSKNIIYTSSKYDERVDIWAIGCLTYELIIGIPFSNYYSEVVYECYNISLVGIDFIKMILIEDYKKRPYINDLILHTWIQ